MPWELPALMGIERAREGLRQLNLGFRVRELLKPDPGSSFARVATLEAACYMRNQLLRDTDWASMAHSLEVRPPLVDRRLLEQLAPVLMAQPGLQGKQLMVRSPRQPLFGESTARVKSGFTTPVERWIQTSNPLRGGSTAKDLARAGCHWARRWAYSVAKGMTA